MSKETISKKTYYRFEMSLATSTPYRAIFYNLEDIPPAPNQGAANHIRDMTIDLKANRPYAVWHGPDIFAYLPYVNLD